jgi:AraC-like DNA-binding protein
VPGRLSRLSTLNATRTGDQPQPRLKPRGLPPALKPHGVYSATNPADAAAYGSDLLGSHRVHVDAADAADFLATYHAILIRDVTLGYLDYSTAVRVEVRELGEDHLVIVPATGLSTITNRGRVAHTSPVMAAVPHPGTELVLECGADAAHLVVRIHRQALELHLSRLLGRTIDHPIEFDLELDLSAGSASRWNFAVQMLHAELFDHESLLHRNVGLGQLEEFIMSSLLYTQPSNYSEQLAHPTNRAIRRAVRRSCDYIERNLSEPLTVQMIADAAGISVRTLQNQFMEDLRQTPTAYVKNRRLERVRADLADARPGSGVTVTDIASRWGFTHLGRFSVTYRSRFGETPSQTLRT